VPYFFCAEFERLPFIQCNIRRGVNGIPGRAEQTIISAQQATVADLQSNVSDPSLQAGDNAVAITELQAAVAALQQQCAT